MTVSKAPKAATYEPGRYYKITVNRVVNIGGAKITPKFGGIVIGSALSDIHDAIVTALPVE